MIDLAMKILAVATGGLWFFVILALFVWRTGVKEGDRYMSHGNNYRKENEK